MSGSSHVGVSQDPMADLVNTRDYLVQYSDSPASIAKKFGIAMSTLLAANPQKPTTVTAGVRTFRDLRIGEILNIPSVGLSGTGVGFNFLKAALVPWGTPSEIIKAAEHRRHVDRPSREGRNDWEHWRRVHPGTPYSDYQNWWTQYGQNGGTISGADTGVGQSPADAVAALTVNDPCDPANVGLVWAAQQALGLQPDGKWGSGSSSAANAKGFPGPAGCSPRPSWWAPAGQVNQPPSGGGGGTITTLPQITITPTPGTGPSPAPPPPVGGSPSTASPAVQNLTLIDPCDPTNVSAVGAAQTSLGMKPDGKYGTDTYKKAFAQLGSFAPSACNANGVRPSWWLPPGQSNLGGAAPAPAPIPVAAAPAVAQAAQAAQQAAQVAAQATTPAVAQQAAQQAQQAAAQATQAAQQNPTPANQQAAQVAQQAAQVAVSHEKKHRISTGAIVAGAVGLAALVGIVAMAVSGKGKTTTRYRTRKGKTRYITRKPPKKHGKHSKGKKRAHKKHGKKR
jgi:hypothetical protein